MPSVEAGVQQVTSPKACRCLHKGRRISDIPVHALRCCLWLLQEERAGAVQVFRLPDRSRQRCMLAGNGFHNTEADEKFVAWSHACCGALTSTQCRRTRDTGSLRLSTSKAALCQTTFQSSLWPGRDRGSRRTCCQRTDCSCGCCLRVSFDSRCKGSRCAGSSTA